MKDNETRKEEPVYVSDQKDSSLCHLVICANHGWSVGVTILTYGQLITGQLVSGEQFLKKASSNIRSSKAGEDVINVIASHFDDLSNEYRIEEGHTIPVNYLHIQDPSYQTANGWQKFVDTIVRIDIRAVNGFSIGSYDS
ncbi:hypothetical protein G3M83_09320 [Rouxiella badensis]|uniref:hypothetical protein n=1 Tax=Rouxiella badensis TaxID=1646377 RepID=UPI0013EF16CD|nr:hypothetical protein [Rouxiella badensis]QII37881.1 hypothetical protein G3M83_09320 [Rouxiella badensis]